MRLLVTGAAGFVGSNLVDHLLADGHEVVGYDNLSTGQLEFLAGATANGRFRLARGDILDRAALTAALAGCDAVFHFAANADVRFGTERTRVDLDQNVVGTWNVLESMRAAGVRRILMASTGAIYGDTTVYPTPENAPFPIQTSLYSASKLAAEAYIQAYAEGFGIQGVIFRLVSILGERYSHGHVFDFLRQLRAHPERIEVLGNGQQRKSYLYVADCVRAMSLALAKASGRVEIFNLGTDEVACVDDSISWIAEYLGLAPRRVYQGGERGWVGDNPLIVLDCTRIKALGWAPRHSIREGVERTVAFLQENLWLLERR
ncbi:MAG: NAD-dependent epimerase/dehydratase family protein [Deltaproteobacteria bacterium]|nr:NAD-dependent epimerase/dehydratase family protein [Deltaproteobacteria bacterium]